MLKTKYDEQVALNLTQTEILADRDTEIRDLKNTANANLTPQNLSANLQGAVAIDETTLKSALDNLNGAITEKMNYEISTLIRDSYTRYHALEFTLTDLNAKFDNFFNASAILPCINRSTTPPPYISG